jgi:hypothetical protein
MKSNQQVFKFFFIISYRDNDEADDSQDEAGEKFHFSK